MPVLRWFVPSVACVALLTAASPAGAGEVLFRQTAGYANGGPSIAISTLPALETSAAEGADDFSVPGPVGWSVSEVGLRVAAMPNGVAPDLGMDVVVLDDDAGRPADTVVCERRGVMPYEWQSTFGDTVRLALPTPCDLPPGTYWLKLTALTTTSNRYWWGATFEGSGSMAVWRNPGDGFESGCIDWTPIAPDTCFSAPPGLVGFAFWLIGRPIDQVFASGFEPVPPLPPLLPPVQ